MLSFCSTNRERLSLRSLEAFSLRDLTCAKNQRGNPLPTHSECKIRGICLIVPSRPSSILGERAHKMVSFVAPRRMLISFSVTLF